MQKSVPPEPQTSELVCWGFLRRRQVSAPAELDQRDIRFETFRAGGPGGQHQNKTDSAVRAIHVPTGMTVVSKEERSQFQNKRVAVERLSNRLQREKVEQEAKRRDYENRLQKSLERGNPIRRFRGSAFKAER